MKNILNLSIILLFSWVLVYCNSKNESKEDYKKYAMLSSDSINEFQLGDTFMIQTYNNSCCTNCWVNIDQYADTFTHKGLIEKIKVKEIPSDGADGSSSFADLYYKCVKTGTDTLYYAVIPNGDIDSGHFDCSQIAVYRDSASGKLNVPKENVRRYIFNVK